MCEHLLSLTHIQKLGHPIEEIRLRALSSVLTKYNLSLVDESNLENTKLLLEKLLNWFEFEKQPEEEKVLRLILKILKYENADLILKEIDVNNFLKKLNVLEKKINPSYCALIKDIKETVSKNLDGTSVTFFSEVNIPHDLEKLDLQLNLNLDDLTATSKQTEDSVENLKSSVVRESFFKIEYFPWQHLIPGDTHVLSSVYEGLRYIDNKNSILQTCQFYLEVVLRDFPPEVFIQRPLIIRTLLQLIKNSVKDTRICVIKCLIQTIQQLKEGSILALNSSLFHLKPEFYSTSVFANDDDSQISDCLNLGMIKDFFVADCDSSDQNIMRYQLSLPQFCFEVLEQVLPCLGKKCNVNETNALIQLVFETIMCLTHNIRSTIWNYCDIINKFHKIFGLLQDSLKHHKGRNQVDHIIMLYITLKVIKSLNPTTEKELEHILPRSMQIELSSCITNSALVLIFPHLHSEIVKYIEKLPWQKDLENLKDYKEFLCVLESMKSSVKFLKSGHFRNRTEKLECINQSLLSLDFHQNFNLIKLFVSSCLLKWSKCQLKDKEIKMREKILVKLLAHSNDEIKMCIYQEINECVVKLLGVEEAAKPRFEFPGDKLEFMFSKDVLVEIICHGLSSTIDLVRKCSNEIFTYLLKSKFIMSEICWSEFIIALTPCLSLIQCYADKSTALGRCIIKMFDPDVAKTSHLPAIEVLKGNIRFLFSKNNLIRDEAMSRLFWLLGQEDRENQKLPRMSVLTGLNLSGICSCVKPLEYTKIRQSFYSPGRLCDVLEMLSDENAEPNLRRSALSQISVMMEDAHLHTTFLEQKGLEKILKIFENCLIEKEYRNYPDSVIPIIDILKHLSLHNGSVRQDLTTQIEVIYSILRGLFLFSSDDTLRRNAVELLCLLLYSDCILRVPPDVSIKCSVSFPEIVVNRMCLPFLTHIHWRSSRHLESSTKRSLMGKESCAKLIRTSWAIQWMGGLSDVFSVREEDLSVKTHSPGIPDEMKISFQDIESLKNCAFGISVKQSLYSIQNATTHEAVYSSLHKLHTYFLLYNIDKAVSDKTNGDLVSDTMLSHMLWESTLERFMTSQPFCIEDESLLLEVVKLLQFLLKSFKSERLIDWIEKILVDDHQSLAKMLKKIRNQNFGLVGRELRLALIELAQEVVCCKSNLDSNKWFTYMEVISDYLKLDNKDEFYNVAFVDWFLCLLVDLSGKKCWNFNNKTDYYENLILRLIEIIIAFHCTKDSAVSFMGLNIVKNSLFVLNHILLDGQKNVKNWEKLWHEAFSKIIGHQGDSNYCWLLSLWFLRDSLARAAAFQFFVGFTTTAQSCELLIDRFNIPFEHIWDYGFKVLFDEKECSLVKEKCALLLSNLTNQGTKFSCEDFVQHLEKVNFYKEVVKIILNYYQESKLPEIVLNSSTNTFSEPPISTPSFLTTVCILIQSVLTLNPSEVSDKIFESGVLECLTKILGEIPESAIVCGKHQHSADTVQMYTSICRLITKCIVTSWSSHSFMLQSPQCVNALFIMFDFNLFCDKSKSITALKSELWSEILNLFAALLMDNPECNNNGNTGFLLLNKSMSDNGIDNFISSLYLALTSDVLELRASVFNFFINFFRHEMSRPKYTSIGDMFDRKISATALEMSMRFAWKGLHVSETLTLNFGIRAADILNQLFLLISNSTVQCCKTIISDGLGSLLAVCKSAQDFCVHQGLPDSTVLSLKQICVKLNLESVENLKKISSKKKITSQLVEAENLFRLIANLVLGNEKAKVAVADCALSAVVHKLWPWCMAKRSLHVVVLKTLCTFTHSCDQACRTLVLSTNLTHLGLKKSPGSVNLMTTIMNQVTLEMDSISATHDSQILSLCLQLVSNCCRVTECRTVISKGSFLQSVTKIHPNRKKKAFGDGVVDPWLKFLIAFSCHQEGQLTLTKSQDVLDLLISLSSATKSGHRIDALTVLRNICFHQLNRMRMLTWPAFLSRMLDAIDSTKPKEIQAATVAFWALSCNSQKAKVVLRSSGLDSKLAAAKRNAVLNEDTETADLISVLLDVMKNK